jgi:hypothetical protein
MGWPDDIFGTDSEAIEAQGGVGRARDKTMTKRQQKAKTTLRGIPTL